MSVARDLFRRTRVAAQKLAGREPNIRRDIKVPLEFHGNVDAGWFIPSDSLGHSAVVVDVGLGEDISFSTSIIARYGCEVHGFDPTPRALAYARNAADTKMHIHDQGLAGNARCATFYLPNDQRHVSGSLDLEPHVGLRTIEVTLVDMDGLFAIIAAEHIDLLKMDIEGAEYGVIASAAFRERAASIKLLCIEFHHRWQQHGASATQQACTELRALGFDCAWISPTSNEEFLFVNRRAVG